MSLAIERARDGFTAAHGAAPEGVAFASGRVNLIGDHVDYNDGLVLPMPLELGTAVAWRPRSDGRIAVTAGDYNNDRHEFGFGDPPDGQSGWQSLAQGMAAVMASEGLACNGADLFIAGDLPRGSGLSSSASLCIAIGRALIAAQAGADISPRQLALMAQQVEHRFAGVACGIMDQMVIAAGETGKAMLLDCRSLEWRNVTLPADWSVIIAQSGVTRELVEGAYNARRSECENAASGLGVASLRDVDPNAADVSGLGEVEARRARHVIGEIERTRLSASAIEHDRIEELGQLFRASHASMRDDFQASHPQVDELVERINALVEPQGGARMTGGGFGGAIVIVCHSAEADAISQQLCRIIGPGEGSSAMIIRAIN